MNNTRDLAAAFAREYPAGTVLFEEHDPGSRMYVIRSGRVKIYRRAGDQEIVLAFLETGDFFGEMALLEGLPRSAGAVTVEPSILIEVDQTTFEEMIRRNIEVAIRIMRRLAGRVRELDQRLERQMVDSSLDRALDVLRWLLPQGLVQGRWIRVPNAADHLDIAAQAGIPSSQAKAVVRRLEEADCLKFDGADVLVAHGQALDDFASYLSLKRKYEEDANQNPAHKPEAQQAVKRLMSALSLSPEEANKRSRKLAEDYQRYLSLQARFKDIAQ